MRRTLRNWANQVWKEDSGGGGGSTGQQWTSSMSAKISGATSGEWPCDQREVEHWPVEQDMLLTQCSTAVRLLVDGAF